jgi:hypothetical protein
MFVHNSTLRHFEVVTFYIKLLTILIIYKKRLLTILFLASLLNFLAISYSSYSIIFN